MRVSLVIAAGLSATLLAACAPASETKPAAPAAEAEHHDHDGHDHAAGADEAVDRGVIAGTLAFLEGNVLVPPAGRDVTAGFGTFSAGERPITIIAVEAPFAQTVEMHTSETSEDGMMSMRKVDSIAIPANGDHSLGRGGDHLMFFGVQPDSLQADTTATLTVRVQLEDGTTEDIEVPLSVTTRD